MRRAYVLKLCFSALSCFVLFYYQRFIFACGKFDVIFIDGIRGKYINHCSNESSISIKLGCQSS